MSNFVFQSDVGSNHSQQLDKHSPLNYVTHAQQSKVFTVKDGMGNLQYIWLGNQWVTAQEPGNPRNKDLLYWDILNFNSTGGIEQFTRKETIIVSI